MVEAHGYQVRPERVRIVEGKGTSAAAAAAFVKGNPAITLGNTIHFKSDRYRSDFLLKPKDVALLVHEWTHVVQYSRIGYAAFAAKYGRDLKQHGFNPDKLYKVLERESLYREETLEGQAEMAGLLTYYRCLNKSSDQEPRKSLERRMASSGIYGL